MAARQKSIIGEARQIELASQLIRLGARLQVLESETNLSYERLLRLYKEVAGRSPSKGQLPFSTDWFLTWQPNIHASMFINIHRYLLQHAHMSGISAVIKSYQLYLEQIPLELSKAPVLSLTRAWTLLRFFESKMLTLVECKKCKGNFVTHAFDLNHAYHCGLCNPPARAGKRLACEVAN